MANRPNRLLRSLSDRGFYTHTQTHTDTRTHAFSCRAYDLFGCPRLDSHTHALYWASPGAQTDPVQRREVHRQLIHSLLGAFLMFTHPLSKISPNSRGGALIEFRFLPAYGLAIRPFFPSLSASYVLIAPMVPAILGTHLLPPSLSTSLFSTYRFSCAFCLHVAPFVSTLFFSVRLRRRLTTRAT